MSDEDLVRRRIEALEKGLDGDDARGSQRAMIADHYLQLGDVTAAAKWYLEAARRAEWSELGIVPLTWAKRAVTVAPESLDAWREYKRQWGRAGLEGEPERP